ncbi:hypothetical protein OF83DRAFT_1116751 [Amylostereum chailletii]|nr:hypothetical protein OF83DRAFT_1116751 [Amylostereum chailletii]
MHFRLQATGYDNVNTDGGPVRRAWISILVSAPAYKSLPRSPEYVSPQHHPREKPAVNNQSWSRAPPLTRSASPFGDAREIGIGSTRDGRANGRKRRLNTERTNSQRHTHEPSDGVSPVVIMGRRNGRFPAIHLLRI